MIDRTSTERRDRLGQTCRGAETQSCGWRFMVGFLRWVSGRKGPSGLLWALASLCLMGGCGIPYAGYVDQPRWDADGEHIYYLEQRFISGLHPAEYFRLCHAKPDLTDRTMIASGFFSSIIHPPVPSPDGRTVLFLQGRDLQVYDAQKHRTVRSIRSQPFPPMSLGWKPDSSAFYYTDSRGIHLESPNGHSNGVIVPDEAPHDNVDYFGLGWSSDGELFAYTTGWDWGGRNVLHILDTTTLKEWPCSTMSSGIIESAAFTPDRQRVVYLVNLIEGHGSAIRSDYVLGGDDKRMIWSGPQAPIELSRRPLARVPPAAFLSVWQEGEDGVEHSVSFHAVTVDGEESVLDSVFVGKYGSVDWDYHERTGRLVMNNGPERDGFLVKQIAK